MFNTCETEEVGMPIKSLTSGRSSSGRKSRGRGFKKALCERRTIVFIDESGVSETAASGANLDAARTDPDAAILFQLEGAVGRAGITWWNFYFRLYPGATHATELIDFFGHLMRHLPGKLRVVWDRLPQHRARLVTEFIRARRGPLAIERLPAYAPAWVVKATNTRVRFM